MPTTTTYEVIVFDSGPEGLELFARVAAAQRAARRSSDRIATEHHRRVYAAERLSRELADRDEDLPEVGEARDAAVDEWLEEHPEVIVGAEVSL